MSSKFERALSHLTQLRNQSIVDDNAAKRSEDSRLEDEAKRRQQSFEVVVNRVNQEVRPILEAINRTQANGKGKFFLYSPTFAKDNDRIQELDLFFDWNVNSPRNGIYGGNQRCRIVVSVSEELKMVIKFGSSDRKCTVSLNDPNWQEIVETAVIQAIQDGSLENHGDSSP